MKIFTRVNKFCKYSKAIMLLIFVCLSTTAFAQTTSWKGTTSSDWNTASNWTSGVPTATTAVTIGDANFTGGNQPIIDETAIVNIGSITLVSSAKSAYLTITNDYNVVINGDVTIGLNTTLENSGTNVFYKGNFTNNGTYLETTYFVNKGAKGRYFPSSEFQGTGITIGGTSTINTSHMLISGTATLGTNVVIKALVLPSDAHPQMKSTSDLTVSGTFNPSTYLVSWDPTVTKVGEPAYTGVFTVEAGGTAQVRATTYAGNYGQTATIYATSTIDYAATTGTQTVLARSYGILRISGGGVKELEGNTTVSDIAASTQLLVDAGTLDLKSFTLNRTGSATPVAGGTLTLANGAILRIGGTNTFPAGYQTRNLGSTSTVEYYGTNQTVSNELYGNLTLTSVAASIKTLPSAAMTISGNLLGSGYAAFTALGNININGNITLSDNASFNGGAGFTHTVGGNWTNNANFTGNTSTVTLTGTAKAISRTTATSGTLKNEFNNLTITGAGTTISIPAGATLTINGNLTTTGAGTVSQSVGSLTMAGTSKVISGSNITLNDFIANGSTTTTASFTLNGNYTANSGKSFIASGGTVTMAGSNKVITNSGTTTFFGLRISNNTSTSTSFTINSDLSGNYLTATAGTITFGGATATIAGIHNLFNVTVSGSDRRMVANSDLGIKGVLAVSGALDVTTNTPNTITYDGTSTQSILGRVYHNIVFKNAGTKTASGAITVNGDLTIDAGSNFGGSSYSHNLYGNWKNDGAFTASSSTVSFLGGVDANIYGSINTIFNKLTLNKLSPTNNLVLNTSATTATLTLTTGIMRTANSKSITVTNTRSGNGWVIGTITRTHTFSSGTYYQFAGQYNSILFDNATGIISVTVKNDIEVISNFSDGSALNRLYEVSVYPSGTYGGNMYLQYEDADLNGNVKSNLKMYQDVSKNGTWVDLTYDARSATNNWLRKDGISNLNGNWTLSAAAGFKKWTGAGSNKYWQTPENWFDNQVPTSADIAVFGELGSGVIMQPEINTPIDVLAIQFKGNNAITLDINTGGSLSVSGNIGTVGSAATLIQHNIKTNGNAIAVNGDLTLSSGSNNNSIDLNIGAGSISVLGNLNQNTDSDIVFTGSGTLSIGGNYTKAAGTFASSGQGTIIYNGSSAQIIAPVNYHNLTINKPSGTATLSTTDALNITGNVSLAGSGTTQLSASSLTVDGNVSLSSGTLNAGTSNVYAKGNWSITGGTFVPSTSTIAFTGGNAQSLSVSSFNKLVVNKTSGTILSATGNIQINDDFDIQSGSIDLGTYTANRIAVGGTMTLANGATLALSGANNFPSNFNTYTVGSTSTVEYKGAVAQSVKGITYGNLTLTDGGASNVKSLADATTVAGTLLVNSGSKLNANNQVLTISGNFTVSGEFSPGTYTSPTPPTGTLILASSYPTMKYISGNLEVNNLIVKVGAYYALSSSTLKINGDIDIDGNGNVYTNPDAPASSRTLDYSQVPNNGFFNAMSTSVTIDGNFKNSGMMFSNGTAKFLGGRSQTIQLLSPIIPWASTPPTVEFAGTVSPVLNSTKSPEFGSVVISNTSGVTASVGWSVFGELKVNGGKFFGGSYTHNIYTAITNAGLITSSGVINFEPIELGKGLAVHPFYMGADPAYFQSTGTVRIGGTNLVALSGSIPAVLNNLVIANTNAGGVGTFQYGPSPTQLSPLIPAISGTTWNLGGDFRIESGAKFTAGLGTTYSIGGNLVNNGTLAGSYGSFTLTNAIGLANSPATNATIEGAGAITMANLTIGANAKVEVKQNLTINGNLSHNGEHFESVGVELNFATTSPSAITSTSGSIDIENLKISKSTGTATLSTDLGSVQKIDVVSGTFDITNKVITEATSATSALTVADGATLKLSAETLPTLDDFSFAPTSTVNYYGTIPQTVKGDLQYGHLSLSGASAKTFNGDITQIAGDFTVASGVTGVTTPPSIEYNGENAQIIAAVNYKSLDFATSSDKTLAAGTTGISNAFTNSGSATFDPFSNAATVNYNGANQDVLPVNYHNLSLSNSGTKKFAGTTGVAAEFTTDGVAFADLTSTETTIDFNGTSVQAIPGLDYSKVLLSKGGNKTLAANANIASELRLTDGKISTGSNKFILGNTATIAESEGNSVTGFVETQRAFSGSESFGGIGITISTSKSLGTVTVLRETGSAITAASGNTSILRNFSFGTTGTNKDLDATVSFDYFESELNGKSENTLQLFYTLDGDPWYVVSSSVPTPASNRVGGNGIPSLRQITVASSMSPLPVELKYLRAEKQNQNAVITWETASEDNNKGFDVEVSLDGINYRKLAFVDTGKSTVRAGKLYTYTDKESNKKGTRYYRLKQIDVDGKFAYYGPQALVFDAQQAIALKAYPNPFNYNLKVSFTSENNGLVKAILYTSAGEKVYEETISAEAGMNDVEFKTNLQTLKPGLYLLTLDENGKKHSVKVIKN